MSLLQCLLVDFLGPGQAVAQEARLPKPLLRHLRHLPRRMRISLISLFFTLSPTSVHACPLPLPTRPGGPKSSAIVGLPCASRLKLYKRSPVPSTAGLFTERHEGWLCKQPAAAAMGYDFHGLSRGRALLAASRRDTVSGQVWPLRCLQRVDFGPSTLPLSILKPCPKPQYLHLS